MKNVFKIAFLLSLAVMSSQNTMGQEPIEWAEKMAISEMQRNPEAWMLDFSTRPRWNYCHGLVLLSMQQLEKATGSKELKKYISDYTDLMISDDGVISDYNAEKYNIDAVNTGKILFELYKETGEEKFAIALKTLREQMRNHPKIAEGGFWHKKVYPHQMWLDGLYMASPFLAQYAAEFNEPALFDEVTLQIKLIEKYNKNPENGLYHHGWDESREQRWSNKTTGKSAHVWGRGLGWYAMTLVDVLDYLPEEHPDHKLVVSIVQELAETLVTYQDEEKGLWYQVMDVTDRDDNYLESTGSTMFVYFLKKALNKGYISEDYEAVAQKAYEGIFDEFIRENENGNIDIIKGCAGAGLGGKPYRDGTYEYYIEERIRANDPKAVGPFIMLSLEFQN